MPNTNPIKLKDTGEYPLFIIPQELSAQIIFLDVSTVMFSAGWQLDVIHSVHLGGQSLDFDADQNIVKLKLGKVSSLSLTRFAISSITTRLRNGGVANLPPLTYKLKFYTDNIAIDQEYELSAGTKNPQTFYTKITFNIEST